MSLFFIFYFEIMFLRIEFRSENDLKSQYETKEWNLLGCKQFV